MKIVRGLPFMALLLFIFCTACEKNDTDVNALFRRWDFTSQERLSITNPDGPDRSERRDTWTLVEDDMFFKFYADYTLDSHSGPGTFRMEGDMLFVEIPGRSTTYQYTIRSRELKLKTTYSEPNYREEVTFTLRAR